MLLEEAGLGLSPHWKVVGGLDDRDKDKVSGLGVASGAPASGSAPCRNVPGN